MTRTRRANGAGNVYIKHGNYYGRWYSPDRGRTNHKLGPVRRPGTAAGLTRAQAERQLRAIIDEDQGAIGMDHTIASVGVALLAHLEAKGCAKSHRETVESHLRVHVVPFFKDKAVDGIGEDDVTRLLVRLRRRDLSPKTIRNIASTLHSLFQLALRKRWILANPCTLIDLPAARPNADIRDLTQDELTAVVKSRGVPLAGELRVALTELARTSRFISDDDLVFANPLTGDPLDRFSVRKRFQRACRRAGVRVVRFHDLRHTFGTRVAASGEVSLRTLQEWMGHRDAKTTSIYADYQPAEREADIVSRAFQD